MRILVVGSGGREHALAWKIARDSSRPSIFCAPGNAGTLSVATNLPIEAEDIEGLVGWAAREKPDLVVVGPEVPLCMGLADRLEERGIPVFGPSRLGAMLEGSKTFSKEIMNSAHVPTAASLTCTTIEQARRFIQQHGIPVVLKADGLAAGKGVYVCMNANEVESALQDLFINRVLGKASDTVVVEEYLAGEEASILALVDGRNIVLLPSAQDHKRVFNNDEGPNTGGMGAYSPAPVVTDAMLPEIMENIMKPVLFELQKRGIAYKGVLYAGLMITARGPKVLEFNCRFGDPETQAILPRIEGDILPALMACAKGGLKPEQLRIRKEASVCVVMASGGYPGTYVKGKPILGLSAVAESDDLIIFHAGTTTKNGIVVTSGGRVLGVTALGETLKTAVKHVYTTIPKLSFDQAQYRTDIAVKAFGRRN